jgi:hypothetical protein
LGYRCPELWWSLATTPDPKVRFCDRCQKSVYLCETPGEFIRRGEQGECVAVGPERVGMSLAARMVGQPSAEAVAELAARKAALAGWWAEVIARLPSALGASLEPLREQVARGQAEAEPSAAVDRGGV